MSKIAKGSALAFAALALAGTALAGSTATNVTVAMTEFKFALTPKTAKKGTVVFKLVNKGKLEHDFKIAGKKSPIVDAGESATLRVTFKKAGRYPYICTIEGHATFGMKGVLVVK